MGDLRQLFSATWIASPIQRIFGSAGIVITEPMMVKQMPTIHAMVAEGLGVSLIPHLSSAGGLSCRALPLKPRFFRHIGMIRSASYVPVPFTEVWLSLVRERMKKAKRLPSKPSIAIQRIAGELPR